MGRVVGDSCRECGEKWQQKPPCFHLESKKFFIVKATLGGGLGVGGSCPFVADISLVRTWCDRRNAIPSPASDDATNLLKYLRSLSKDQLEIRLSKSVRDSVDNRSSLVFNREMRAYIPLYRASDGQSLLRIVRGLVGKGPLEPGQIAVIKQSSKQPVALPASSKTPKVVKVSGTFVHHTALTVDNCGVDWGGLAKASNVWQASREGGYSDNLKRVSMLAGGLRRIEESARAGFSEKYLRPALKSKLPSDTTGVELALAIGKGVAWQIGLMAGAAALGVAGGAAIGTFFVPGLGTAAGAAAGASMATLMLNYVLTANDLKDSGEQLAAESKKLKSACELAVQDKTEEAKKAFAAVAAAILCIILIAILAKFVQKGWAGLQKLRAKHKAALEAHVNAHAEHKGPKPVPVHGQKKVTPPKGHKVKGKFGYFAEHLLQRVNSGKEIHLRESEYKTFMEIGKDHCAVVRIGDADRVAHLDSGLWARGKPTWMGQKSGVASEILVDGKHDFSGMLAFRKTEVAEGLTRAVNKNGKPKNFNMKMLGGKFVGQGQRPVFEIPDRDIMGENFKRPGEKLKILDSKKYKQDREKCYLVQVSNDHFIIVDAMGQPFVQDVDIALIQAKKQTGEGWEELGKGKRGMLQDSGKGGPDSLRNEDAINRRIRQLEEKRGKTSLYNLAEHGGDGGSPLLTDKNGRVIWSPLDKDGNWDQEELAVFLPTQYGPRAFKFAGWKEFGAFCDANGLPFPYDKEATRKLYK